MELDFRPFGRSDYAEYAAWFADPELDRRLGPMNEAWLEATLEDAAYETWAVFLGAEFVGVLEAALDISKKLAVVAGIATKPEYRQRGIAAESLRWLLAWHYRHGLCKHMAQVAADNVAALRLLERLNFALVEERPNEEGYLLLELERAVPNR